MKLTPNITLSNGRVIGSRYTENGSQDLFDVADPERLASLSDEEHAEVMAAIHAFRNPVVTRTRACDNCGNDLTDPDEIFCESCKNPILTVKLRNGRTVLAKIYDCFTMAVTYANRTQAEKKAARLGNDWEVFKGPSRPFHVARKEAK